MAAQMKYLDLTLDTPAANLACDEALLEWSEDAARVEVLRVWRPSRRFVVLGYSNQAEKEVHLDNCRAERLPVLRRCTGGGTVVQGPGVLNYTLILNRNRHPDFDTVTGTNRRVMETHRELISELLNRDEVRIEGHTDLVLGTRKFSGNSQRRRRDFILFHGTFLIGFDIGCVGRFLRYPSKAPDYRAGRSHDEFLTNLNLTAEQVGRGLVATWDASEALEEVSIDRLERLVREKYGSEKWTLRR